MFVGILLPDLERDSRVSQVFRNQFARGQETIGSHLNRVL